MKMTLEMSAVEQCAVSDCVYNLKKKCSARAVTIGHGVHPGCDTFMSGSTHAKPHDLPAGVGACKVTICSHNSDYECVADHIQVARSGGEINCMTFKAR